MIVNNPHPIEEDAVRFKNHINTVSGHLSRRIERKSTTITELINKTDDMLAKCANAVCAITGMMSLQFVQDPEEVELRRASHEVLKRIGEKHATIRAVVDKYQRWLIDLTELKEKLMEYQQIPEASFVPGEDWFRPLTRVGKATVNTKEQLLDFVWKVCNAGDFINGTVYSHGGPEAYEFSSLSELSFKCPQFEDILALTAHVNVRNRAQSLLISLENAGDGFKILRSKRHVHTESFQYQQGVCKLLNTWLDNPQISVGFKTRSLLRTYLKAVLNTHRLMPCPMYDDMSYKNLLRMYYHFSVKTPYLYGTQVKNLSLSDPLTMLAYIKDTYGDPVVSERGVIDFVKV